MSRWQLPVVQFRHKFVQALVMFGRLVIARPGFTVVSNRCLTNKAMLVLVEELNLL